MEILDGVVVTQRRAIPCLLGDDLARRPVRLEARRGVQLFHRSPELERELTATLREDGELDARGARVQNQDGVLGFIHRFRPASVIATLVPSGIQMVSTSQVPERVGLTSERERTCTGTTDARMPTA